MDEADPDVLAFMGFPKAHRMQINSTNPLARLNAEIKRRTRTHGSYTTSWDVIYLRLDAHYFFSNICNGMRVRGLLLA